MVKLDKTIRTCKNGHSYYKSSDCPVCPICENKKNPANDFLSVISAPARRALENAKIKTLQDLSKFSEKELLKLHGIGPSVIPKLNTCMRDVGLSFKK